MNSNYNNYASPSTGEGGNDSMSLVREVGGGGKGEASKNEAAVISKVRAGTIFCDIL